MSGGWNKGINSRKNHICNFCKNIYVKYSSCKSKYCCRECWRKSIIGHKFNLGIKQTEESNIKRRLANLKRKEINGYINSPKTREKSRLSAINNIKNKTGLAVNIGKNETQFLDELELSLGYKIIRQYPICGYFVDGYCKELNLCIEIDEKFHKKRKHIDIQRQKYIENKLNCRFMRIKDARYSS